MLGELARERADRAAAARLTRLLKCDERIRPGEQAADRVELREQAGLAADDVVADRSRDRAHQIVAVGEVVIQLALGHVCASAYIVERGARHAALARRVRAAAVTIRSRVSRPFSVTG